MKFSGLAICALLSTAFAVRTITTTITNAHGVVHTYTRTVGPNNTKVKATVTAPGNTVTAPGVTVTVPGTTLKKTVTVPGTTLTKKKKTTVTTTQKTAPTQNSCGSQPVALCSAATVGCPCSLLLVTGTCSESVLGASVCTP